MTVGSEVEGQSILRTNCDEVSREGEEKVTGRMPNPILTAAANL